MLTKCFELLQKQGFGSSEIKILKSSFKSREHIQKKEHRSYFESLNSPSNLLLTVPRRYMYFYCGSSVLYVIMYVCIWSRAIWSPYSAPYSVSCCNLEYMLLLFSIRVAE